MNLKESLNSFFAAFQGKNIVTPRSSSFPRELICGGMVVSICLDKSVPMSL